MHCCRHYLKNVSSLYNIVVWHSSINAICLDNRKFGKEHEPTTQSAASSELKAVSRTVHRSVVINDDDDDDDDDDVSAAAAVLFDSKTLSLSMSSSSTHWYLHTAHNVSEQASDSAFHRWQQNTRLQWSSVEHIRPSRILERTVLGSDQRSGSDRRSL